MSTNAFKPVAVLDDKQIRRIYQLAQCLVLLPCDGAFFQALECGVEQFSVEHSLIHRKPNRLAGKERTCFIPVSPPARRSARHCTISSA